MLAASACVRGDAVLLAINDAEAGVHCLPATRADAGVALPELALVAGMSNVSTEHVTGSSTVSAKPSAFVLTLSALWRALWPADGRAVSCEKEPCEDWMEASATKSGCEAAAGWSHATSERTDTRPASCEEHDRIDDSPEQERREESPSTSGSRDSLECRGEEAPEDDVHSKPSDNEDAVSSS